MKAYNRLAWLPCVAQDQVELCGALRCCSAWSVQQPTVGARARAQTSSIQAYKPTAGILDYACTKGAIVAFTKGLGMDLFTKHGIRVNTVAPGPVWCAAPAACTQSLCTKLLLRFTFSRGSI